MKMRVLIVILLFAVTAVPIFQTAAAEEVESPWVIDLKGGVFAPDLPNYSDFYGSSNEVYLGAAFAYRFKPWLDLGAELGYFKDSGVGFQPSNMALGGNVDYRLVPLDIYVNFRGEFSLDQLFVPYAGGGLTVAWYEQDIQSQSKIQGRTDLGYNLRAGVQLFLNRLDRRTAARAASGSPNRSYLYAEVKYFSSEVDGTDLGGIAYLLGLRLEYDWGRKKP
jgi:opacity protein-like surface antigen